MIRDHLNKPQQGNADMEQISKTTEDTNKCVVWILQYAIYVIPTTRVGPDTFLSGYRISVWFQIPDNLISKWKFDITYDMVFYYRKKCYKLR